MLIETMRREGFELSIIGAPSRGLIALKPRQLTNFRSTGKDEAVRLTPPRATTGPFTPVG